ncbi:cation diffusion facilitator family transporter [Hydrogenimonas thermophila]|uniref:cation diffusion facilitator family transporter n=1 Tax=Hydrogenimonas thermophila TaxID=223786 RepID=UPI0029371250|nr:cation diffusion facilitator family transporter [Hydrogenimonas thermophila]WOE68841.1 cation diffusion facilitator family transporter [Hydrogenimonas thermophila]WOE71349.1 cation diffusion facilitator family transporter [Hydrogenimonas thermophila]
MTLQKRATIISSSVAVTLVIIKLIVGIISGSVAVLASAIDSGLDLAVSLFNLFAVSNAEKPADETFNYGRGKIEAIAAVIEGLVITLSGFFIFYEAIQKILHQEPVTHLTASIVVMVISLVMTGALVLFLNHVANITQNMVIKSDALHYKTDLLSNGSILVSLVVIYFTDFYLIDAILGILIAIYIVYSAFELIQDGILVLLDASLDEDIVEKIKEVIENEPGVNDYHWLRTRKAGNDYFVDVHLVFTPEMSLLEAHRIADSVEAKIKTINPKADWLINIHLDPYDDSDVNIEESQKFANIEA